MKPKKTFERIVSCILAVSLSILQPMTSIAAALVIEPVRVAGTRFTEDQLIEGDLVYFGVTGMTISEGHGIYEVPLYREGDLSKEASVTIHSLDISAIYKDDYALLGGNKKEYKSGKTILEIAATGEAPEDFPVAEYEFDEYGNLLAENGVSLNEPLPEPLAVPEEIKTATRSNALRETGTDMDEDSTDDGESLSELIGTVDANGNAVTKDGTEIRVLSKQKTGKRATASDYDEEETDSSSEKETVSIRTSVSRKDTPAVSTADTDENAAEAAEEADPEKAEKAVSEAGDPGDYEESELLTAESDRSFTGGKSPLAVLKEKETGEPTRETVSTQLGSSLTETIMGELLPDYMRNIPHSAEQVITFEPGEDEKWVRFRIYDDKESEGSEAFSFVITDTEGLESYIATSLSVIISDNEEKTCSRISFDAEEYPAVNGKAIVGVVREEAVHTLATANIAGRDPETGEETVYGTVVFAPYEEEKEVELYPDRPVELFLTDLTAAEEGEITAAVIDMSETLMMLRSAKAEADDDSGLTSDESLTMNVSIAGNNYEVRYKKGDLTAPIYDAEHYDPALEVGQYYFSTSIGKGGIFSYDKGQMHGDKPWGCGVREDRYVIADSETDYAKGYGDLEYYHTSITATGSMWTSNHAVAGKPVINGLYYRYLIPHWEETSSFGGGNKVSFKLHAIDTDKDFGQAAKEGQFGKEFSKEAAVSVKNICDNIEAIAYAVDDRKDRTPKSYLRFYGLAAMYKKFRVSVNDPAKLSFRGASDTVPMQLKVQCGAQLINPGGNDKRDIYANIDAQRSNLVFTVLSNQINGATDIFGKISGYKITISPDGKENAVTAEYPKDFIEFVKKQKGNVAIDYSADTISGKGGVIESVTSHLSTVPFSTYFINWIESLQKMTFSDGLAGKAYYQELKFQPVVEYVDVPVTVVAPDKGRDTCGAKFNDPLLQVKEGTVVTFHAGDRLNFASTSDKPDDYRVTGFEISEDGGAHFNIIRDTYDFTLLPNRKYMVRPLLEKNDNHVEIIFENEEAKKNLQVENLIPDSELASVSYLKGKNVLELDPLGKTVADRMKPAVGAACTVRVLVTGKPSDADYVYRPVITDRMTGRKYNAQGYSFILRSNTGDNVIRVGIEKVKASELEEFNINAVALSGMPSIRNDGLGLHFNPAAGYTVSTENGEAETEDPQTKQKQRHVQSIASVAGTDGSVSLTGLKAKQGDRITLLISNGFNDEQVAEVVIRPSLQTEGGVSEGTEAKTVEAGKIEIGYPANAPRVSSLTYDYDKAQSREKTDLTKNQVRCFDDNLTLSASVDGKGRTVKKLVFTVITVNGGTSTYEAVRDAKDPRLFTAKIENMLENLHNGDRITVYAVDEEERTVNTGSGSSTIPIVYPTVETGLVTYVENERLAPKEMNIDGDMGNVNIPLIGAAKESVQSGSLNIARTDWPDKQGFSFSINFDMMLKDTSLSFEEKQKARKAFQEGISKTQELKKSAAEAGKTAENYGYNADQIRSRTKNGGQLNPAEQAALNDYDQKKQYAESIQKNFTSQAKQQEADLTKTRGMVQIRVIFNLDFEFLYDPVACEYVLATTSVTVGGAFDASKTWYTMVVYVPCFLNISGGVELDFSMGGVCPKGKNAYKAGDFEGYSGNIKDIFTGSTFLVELDVAGKIKAQVGAGLCGILSARGYVQADTQMQFVENKIFKYHYGIIVNGGGGFGIDLVLLKLNVDIAKVSKGWGNFAGRTQVNFFNNLVPAGADQIEDLPDAAEISDAYDMDEEDEISVSEYDMGTADLSGFGSGKDLAGLEAQPVPLSVDVLLENAAERTRPELLLLPDGRQFASFIAAGDSGDPSCLYYAVRSKNGTWSTPEPVSGNGTYDAMPDTALMGDKVVIAWMDANKEIENREDFKEQFNAFDISCAIYDTATDTMGETFRLSRGSDSAFYNQGPKLSALEDKFYCAYLTRDISQCSAVEELADMGGHYNTMQLASYDANSGKINNEYVVIRHNSKKDPLVIDYVTALLNRHGTDYLLTAYTLDEDDDLNTGDRDLYLGIRDLTNGVDYWPVRIREDERCQAVPKLTTLNDTAYLSWTEDGKYLELLDVGTLLESLFNNSEIGDVYQKSEPDDAYWYYKGASELGLSEEIYEGSYYEDITEGDFRTVETLLKNREDMAAGIDDYAVTTDGKDLYIFYTDFGPEIEEPVVELYGRRYRQQSGEPLMVSGSEYDGGSGSHSDREWGFTDGVVITNLDKVLDDFDLVMDQHRNISLLSDYYEQWIDEDGKIQYSDNTLVGIGFGTGGSLDIEDISVEADRYMVAGEPSMISFDIVNRGLMEARGFTVRAELDGSTLYEEKFDTVLDTN